MKTRFARAIYALPLAIMLCHARDLLNNGVHRLEGPVIWVLKLVNLLPSTSIRIMLIS